MKRIALFFLSAALIATGCASKSDNDITDPLDAPIEDPVNVPPVVPGYNHPPQEQFQNGVGFRVSAEGQTLYLSIANTSNAPIVLGPKSFRLLLPNRQYSFTPEQHDLLLFPVRTIPPNEVFTFEVVTPDIPDPTGLIAIVNYPPRSVILPAPVEAVENRFDVLTE